MKSNLDKDLGFLMCIKLRTCLSTVLNRDWELPINSVIVQKEEEIQDLSQIVWGLIAFSVL